MTVEQSSGLVTVLAKLQDFKIFGFSKGKFTELGGFSKGVMRMKLKTEQIKISSIYDVDGLIIILPIQGKGKIKMTFGKQIFDFSKVQGLRIFHNVFKHFSMNSKNLSQISKKIQIFSSENFDMSLNLPLEEITRDNQTFYKIKNQKMTFDFTG